MPAAVAGGSAGTMAGTMTGRTRGRAGGTASRRTPPLPPARRRWDNRQTAAGLKNTATNRVQHRAHACACVSAKVCSHVLIAGSVGSRGRGEGGGQQEGGIAEVAGAGEAGAGEKRREWAQHSGEVRRETGAAEDRIRRRMRVVGRLYDGPVQAGIGLAVHIEPCSANGRV